jgi:serine/threonine-protein phosphatase 5
LRDFKAVLKIVPADKSAREKMKICDREIKKEAFEKAIESEGSASPIDKLDIDAIPVETSYDGPHLVDKNVTPEFVRELMARFQGEGLLHRKYMLQILQLATSYFKAQPSLVHIALPVDETTGKKGEVIVCGDTHGQYYDLCNIFSIGGEPSPSNPYLFNGDFVDRGSFSVEVVVALLALKLAYPTGLYMSRGNHETKNMNKIYGFEGEVGHKYDAITMSLFANLFQWLPLASVIENKIFVVHGGLSTENEGKVALSQIASLPRGCEPPESGLMSDLLWADPQPMLGRSPSKRGVGFSFGPDITANFLQHNDLDLVVRSHEVKDEGYVIEHDGKCITIFSAPNYCLSEEMQILTSQGFLFLDQFASSWNDGAGDIMVAGYDSEKETLVFERPSEFILNRACQQTMLDFTPCLEDGTSWWDAADETVAPENTACSHYLSMVVTPEHQMYTKKENCNKLEGNKANSRPAATFNNERNGAHIKTTDYAKCRAETLIPKDGMDVESLRMKSIACNFTYSNTAVTTVPPLLKELNIVSDAKIRAFCELYGYWLGNGSFEIATGKYPSVKGDVVLFHPATRMYVDFCKQRLSAVGLVEGLHYSEVCTDSRLKACLSIHEPKWARVFRAQYQRSFIKTSIATENCEANTGMTHHRENQPQKLLWNWVWEMPKSHVRFILEGLVLASGAPNLNGEKIAHAYSVGLRDEIVAAALFSGYSARFWRSAPIAQDIGGKQGTPDKKKNLWCVAFTEDARVAEPIIKQTHIKRVAYTGRTWCVTMPSGLIWARRAQRDMEGIVCKASRPTVLGNCDQMGNKGAFIRFGEDLKPNFVQYDAVPHPNVPPMRYAGMMGMMGL